MSTNDPLAMQAHDGIVAVFSRMKVVMQDRLLAGGVGLAPLHLRMLEYSLDHPQASQRDLVEAVGKDKSQVARLLNDLEAQGLLTRIIDPGNRRSRLLELTEAGRAACAQFRAQEAAVAAQMFAGVAAPDLEAAVTALAQALANLD